ncbi:polyunsaturated fatty acid 5-lipoxygenase-like isoform X2 [Mercenaria mercenaria]|uniref:polyunsaturated fatty acid 5-lipoxygenase-like isoform X2 n=1 Tax=Mercenaria mercenaria TaxID=6596 RepID=UPI00234E4DE2|nr:polyunsaturated fatty acid 5-lipoxygenase-like isoform X2 [Mercenaria mercenaria]
MSRGKRRYNEMNESSVTPDEDFTVCVEIADRPKTACKAIMNVQLTGDGVVSEEDEFVVSEFPKHVKRGQKYYFPINESKIKNVTGVKVRGDMMVGKAGWNIDKFTVTNNKTGQQNVIPVFTNIKSERTYTFLVDDVSLPQMDSRRERQNDLEEMRDLYELIEEKLPGGPPLVKTLPSEEEFSFSYKLEIVGKLKELELDAKVRELFSGGFKEMADIEKVYHWVFDVFPEPSNLNRWRDDVLFGMQRLMGVNSNVISLCTKIPEKLNVNGEMLQPFLENLSLPEALKRKRIFIIDYEILQNLPTKAGYVMSAPIALFFQRNDGKIVPIAIQLFQKSGVANPVFFPSDPENTWILAKMWFNVADANYHQSVTHLGLTHLKMEGVVASTHRQIHKCHPVYKLLMPHFIYLLAINSSGLPLLLDQGGYGDKLLTLGSDGMKALIVRKHKKWRLDVEGTLPADLKRRGVDNQKLLPHYYYRDDALDLYKAVRLYVRKYLDLYYASDNEVRDDYELQNWRKELTAPVSKQGLDMKGVFGENGKFSSKEQVCLTLTSIIFTCSAQHAAANFRQYEEYAYPPNLPLSLRGGPPKSKCALEEDDLVQSVPEKTTTYDTMVITNVLSTRAMNKLGDFEVK